MVFTPNYSWLCGEVGSNPTQGEFSFKPLFSKNILFGVYRVRVSLIYCSFKNKISLFIYVRDKYLERRY